jgi:hypothetical protein
MADYHTLISRAVEGLEQNTGENRRVLYERARVALVNQLRGVDPPLEEADITRERLALEESIRKVEAEAANREQADAAKPAAPTAGENSLRDKGLRDFRHSIAEAEGLGTASAEANRAARESYGAVPHEQEAAASSRRVEAAHAKPYFDAASNASASGSDSAASDEQEHRPAKADSADKKNGETGWRQPMPPPPFEEDKEEDTYRAPPRSYGRLAAIGIALLLIVGIGAAAYWQRDTLSSTVAQLTASTPAPKPQQAAAPKVQPKIADRIGPSSDTGPGSAAKQPANAPAAAVAQKVVLYEEDPGNPQGKRYVGSAIWRTETVSPGPGLAPELAVRADVEIPERHMRMTWSLRRNTDKALPASHTIEVTFTLPADFDEGGIGNVPGVLMKNSEQARGIPLAGLSVKVTNGYFLIGLSAVDVDKQRNIDLLKTREWFDIPVVYTSGKRAILAMEKGPPGERAFKEAFRAWGE